MENEKQGHEMEISPQRQSSYFIIQVDQLRQQTKGLQVTTRETKNVDFLLFFNFCSPQLLLIFSSCIIWFVDRSMIDMFVC